MNLRTPKWQTSWSVFDFALEQGDLCRGQVEQFVDAGVDVGFGVGQLLGEGLHGGTLLGEVGFPLVGGLWFLDLSEPGRPSSRVGQARFERRPTTAHENPSWWAGATKRRWSHPTQNAAVVRYDGGSIGIRGGAVSHMSWTSAGVRP